jgi:hypothetical protein
MSGIDEDTGGKRRRRSPWPWLLGAGCLLLLFFGIQRRFAEHSSTLGEGSATAQLAAGESTVEVRILRARRASSEPASAEEIVAQKLAQFGRQRREYMYALARLRNVQVPDDVERFFDAVEAGDWERIEAAFNKINGGDSSAGHTSNRTPEVTSLWPAIIDAYGAAEQVHLWPAQELLDYGNSVLGALRPGMVYVGGTDNGRWIPELLNDTSEGERHVIVTQNGLADSSYLDYLRLQYEGRLNMLSDEESQRAFQHYIDDAKRRLEHDRQFPDEPKQVRPGEEIRIVDGKVQVSGGVAVMSINEKLLEMLMAKNPELSFGLQQSFPFRGTYADALPLGPLMELNARSNENTFTPGRAADYLNYWHQTADSVFANPQAGASEAALKSYSHDTVAAANLLASHNYTAEAEQAYRLAGQLWPENPESVAGLADLLAANGRENEARAILRDFQRKYPARKKDLERVSDFGWTLVIGTPN